MENELASSFHYILPILLMRGLLFTLLGVLIKPYKRDFGLLLIWLGFSTAVFLGIPELLILIIRLMWQEFGIRLTLSILLVGGILSTTIFFTYLQTPTKAVLEKVKEHI